MHNLKIYKKKSLILLLMLISLIGWVATLFKQNLRTIKGDSVFETKYQVSI